MSYNTGNYVSVLSHGLMVDGEAAGSGAVPTRTLCANLVAQLESTWVPASPDSVTRAYYVRTADSDDAALAQTSGRRVTIAPSLPGAYSYTPENRGCDRYTHNVSVLIEKRYTTAGDVPTSWIDTEVDWIYNYIVLGFDWDNRTGASCPFNPLLVTDSAEIQLLDLSDLLTAKLFSCQVDIVFHELVSA